MATGGTHARGRRRATAGHAPVARRSRRGGHRAARRRAGRRVRGVTLAAAVLTTFAVGVLGLTIGPRSAVEASTRGDDRPQAVQVADRVHRDAAAALAARPDPEAGARTPDPAALPAGSGQGRRVVFDRSAQRVWLVGRAGRVQRTYLVSGSVYDNLDAGRYRVYSRSRHATAFDLSSSMGHFVRFTKGRNAAIGFHDIPRDQRGTRVQTPAQLGTPLSSGCIRQRASDARALWRFAPEGTRVVVL